MAAEPNSSSSSGWRDDLHANLKKLESLLTNADMVFLKEDYIFAQQLFHTLVTFLDSRSVNHDDESLSKSEIDFAVNPSLLKKSSSDRPRDKEDFSGNTSDVFKHRKSTTNGGVSRKNKGWRNNIRVNYRKVDPSENVGIFGNIFRSNQSHMENTNTSIENLMSTLRNVKADAGATGLTNLASSSNVFNVTPNSSIFSQSNGTNTGYGVNFNGLKLGTSGLVPPINPNMFNNRNITSRAANGVDDSTKKCLDKLRGPDGELPQKLWNIPPQLIENVCNEIMDLDVNVSWDDIGGLHHAKKCVNEMAIMPLLRPDIFKGCRSPGKGLLLFGPPGTGKTMIGKAIAGEAKATFFNISASSVTSKWLGESEQLVRALFGVASCHQPAVIFVDEIDSLLSKRKEHGEHECYRRMKTQFFIGMEGFDSGNDQILLIGATNKPQDLDEAARRRFTKRLYIPLPSSEARAWIVKNILEKDGLFKLSSEDIDSICKLTEGYSGSDMKNLVKDAAMGPVREALKQCTDITKLIKEDIRPVTLQDFEDSLQEVRPSVCLNQLGTYEKWNNQFGSLSTSKTADQVTDNTTDGITKKRKTSDNTSYEIPPPMDQKAEKRKGQAMNGDQTNHKVDVTNGETNEKYYKEKMEVLKGIYEALQAKNKIDEMKLQLKQKILE